MLKIKRIYDKTERSDGYRVLIDGVWPRGIKKQDANIDLWLKEIAPSRELRQWFAHDPAKWGQFKKAYKKELKQKPGLIKAIQEIEKKEKTITLLYAAKDKEHNNVQVLKSVLEK